VSELAAAPGDGARGGGWLAGYRSALSARDLRLLLGGLAISSTGTWAYNVALAAFVFDRTHSFGWVAAAGLVRFLTALALSPYGGVIAERTERIRLLVCSDLGCAVWQAAIALLVATGGPVVLVLVLAGLTAATNVVYNPAVAATIPSLVGEDDLVAANALNDTIDNLVVVAGPAIGALLLLLGSSSVAFAVNAASYLISAVLVSRIGARSRPIDVTDGGSSGPLRQLIVGVRTILSLRAARTLVGFCALVSFAYGADTVLFVAVSAHRLGTGARGYGYLLAGLGIGGLAMVAAVDRISRSRRLALVILVGALGYCLPTALLAVIHSPALAFAVQVLRGGATLIVDALAMTSLQRAVPSEQLGRVFGTFFAFILGSMSLGMVLAPVLIAALGLNGALAALAFGPGALALAAFPALASVDRESAARAQAEAPRVALLEQLGMFAAAPRPVLERLAGAAREVSFPAGATILREGEGADALYVLAQGEVEVTARGEAGAGERRLRAMAAPSYFGEIGVLARIPRTATVTALSDCRCERIEGEALLAALAAAPPSVSLMENARGRLSLTHPSLAPRFPDAGADHESG